MFEGLKLKHSCCVSLRDSKATGWIVLASSGCSRMTDTASFDALDRRRVGARSHTRSIGAVVRAPLSVSKLCCSAGSPALRQYLLDKPFELHTDNTSMQWLQMQWHLSSEHQTKWLQIACRVPIPGRAYSNTGL
jgi:hypothetical protein